MSIHRIRPAKNGNKTNTTRRLYYTLKQDGDGSVNAKFFTSKELCETYSNYLEDEGELALDGYLGEITMKSDSPILFISNIITKEDLLLIFTRNLEYAKEYTKKTNSKEFVPKIVQLSKYIKIIEDVEE